jgi:hypothetical protein
MSDQLGFFDLSDRSAALTTAGHSMGRLTSIQDFALFHGPLTAALHRSTCSKASRPPFDPVRMIKIVRLPAYYSLPDDKAEFQTKDCLFSRQFFGPGLDGKVPNTTAIWLFREGLVKATVKDGADLKACKPVDLAISMLGYENHIGIGPAHGLIRIWVPRAANAHDVVRQPDLITWKNTGSGAWTEQPIGRKRIRPSSNGACSRATSTRGPCRVVGSQSTTPRLVRSVRLCAQQLSTRSRCRSPHGAVHSHHLHRQRTNKRFGWRTWPMASSGLPGSKGEVCLHSAKPGC